MNLDVVINIGDLLAFILVTPELLGESRMEALALRAKRAAILMVYITRRRRLFGRRLYAYRRFPEAVSAILILAFGIWTVIAGRFPPFIYVIAPAGLLLNVSILLGFMVKALSVLARRHVRRNIFLIGCALFVTNREAAIYHAWKSPAKTTLDLSNAVVRLHGS